jgi:hypothetical protein
MVLELTMEYLVHITLFSENKRPKTGFLFVFTKPITLRDLKQLVYEKHGIPIDEQIYGFQGRYLSGDTFDFMSQKVFEMLLFEKKGKLVLIISTDRHYQTFWHNKSNYWSSIIVVNHSTFIKKGYAFW